MAISYSTLSLKISKESEKKRNLFFFSFSVVTDPKTSEQKKNKWSRKNIDGLIFFFPFLAVMIARIKLLVLPNTIILFSFLPYNYLPIHFGIATEY